MTPIDRAVGLLSEARRAGAEVTIAVAPSGAVAILITPCVSNDPAGLLSLEEAADLARLRTPRPLRDAIRRGDLAAFGSERTRTVKRRDLLEWVESRRAKPVEGVDDSDIDLRVRRIKARKAGSR